MGQADAVGERAVEYLRGRAPEWVGLAELARHCGFIPLPDHDSDPEGFDGAFHHNVGIVLGIDTLVQQGRATAVYLVVSNGAAVSRHADIEAALEAAVAHPDQGADVVTMMAAG